MKLEHGFDVDAPLEETWELLMDVPRVVPCMPGASLEETLGPDHWKAAMRVAMGPVNMVFDTDLKRTEVDQEARRATLKADARERSNRGAARATVISAVSGEGGTTRVDLTIEMMPSGTLARFGRGMIEEVLASLLVELAGSLEQELGRGEDGSDEPAAAAGTATTGTATRAAATAPAPPKPVNGMRLLWRAFGRWLRARFA